MQPVAASSVWSKKNSSRPDEKIGSQNFEALLERIRLCTCIDQRLQPVFFWSEFSHFFCPENMILTHKKGVCHKNDPNWPDYRFFFIAIF
jgi:hypothetical protein